MTGIGCLLGCLPSSVSSWLSQGGDRSTSGVFVKDVDVKLKNQKVSAKLLELTKNAKSPLTMNDKPKERPLIIYFHGVVDEGDDEDILTLCAIMLGCNILAINYRLARGPQDCYKSVKWIRKHLKSFPCNGKLLLMGDNTGGLIAIEACLRSGSNNDVIGAIPIYPNTAYCNGDFESPETKWGGKSLLSTGTV